MRSLIELIDFLDTLLAPLGNHRLAGWVYSIHWPAPGVLIGLTQIIAGIILIMGNGWTKWLGAVFAVLGVVDVLQGLLRFSRPR